MDLAGCRSLAFATQETSVEITQTRHLDVSAGSRALAAGVWKEQWQMLARQGERHREGANIALPLFSKIISMASLLHLTAHCRATKKLKKIGQSRVWRE